MSAAEDHAAAERAKLNEAMVVMSAERPVIDARMADLVEVQRAARARHIAAKGQVTRALKEGSAEKIAVAHERERAASAEFDHISRAALGEMFTLNNSGLDNVGRVLRQLGPTWAAEGDVTRQLTHPEPEAEL